MYRLVGIFSIVIELMVLKLNDTRVNKMPMTSFKKAASSAIITYHKEIDGFLTIPPVVSVYAATFSVL